MPAKFQTPQALPVEVTCRTLTIPSDKYWLGIFNSALLEMLNPYLWEKVNDTDLEIDATIAIVESIINEYWLTESCGEVPTFTASAEEGLVASVDYDALTHHFHFVLPKGATGATGAKGDTGDTGATGEKGDKGDKGDTGDRGDSPNTELPLLTADDKDEIFGGAMALLVHLDERVKDFLSALAAATNVLEAVSELVSAVPLLGLLPFDEILAVMNVINDIGASVINAALTPELREGLACALFCDIVENGGVFNETILINWRGAHLPTGNAGQAAIINMSEFLPLKEHFDRYFLGLNDLNADWETLCDCLPVEGEGETLYIPFASNTPVAMSSPTVVDQWYKVTFRGYISTFSGCPNYLADAIYLENYNNDVWYHNLGTSGVDWFLGASWHQPRNSVQFQQPPQAYNALHEYTFWRIGTGHTWQWRWSDSNYGNNASCGDDLRVTIKPVSGNGVE